MVARMDRHGDDEAVRKGKSDARNLPCGADAR